ncbi:MAG: YbaB/EbfC family nucleoid-associated protein [Verrucomicrobiales bacterium]|nr:YbaB/EbfC family nucleoid-associated protein [Verrucomicrobiales bacterium]MCP5526266.1 YbaB/EbfC family nucleoid-associated protein [Verrucomicrobiales bacterium]
MANIAKLMKQAAAMQRNMQQMQDELASRTVEAEAGGGAVKVTVTCGYEVTKIELSPALLQDPDPEFVAGAIKAAMNQALQKVSDTTREEMGRLTGGMSLPGLM